MSVWEAVLARRAREDALEAKATANQQRDVARHLSYISDIRLSYQLIQEGQRTQAKKLLRRHEPAPGEADFRGFAWHYLMRLCHVQRRTLRGHSGAVYHARFTPDGQTLVTCGKDGTVRFWEVATGRQVKAIVANQQEVNWDAFSPDGRTLATVGDDGTVKLWDTETYAEQASIHAHEGDVIFVAFEPNGRSLITAGRNDCMVRVWDRETRRVIAERRAEDHDLDGVALSPDGKTLATAGRIRYVKLWSLADLGNEPTLLDLREQTYAVAYSSDGRQLATGGVGNAVRVWGLDGGLLQGKFLGTAHTRDIQSVNFFPDGRVVVSAGTDGSVRLWDTATGDPLGTLLGHTDKIWGITVSPDGSTLASASSDGTVRLWDTWTSIQEIARMPAKGNVRGALAFTPDDRTLIAAQTVLQADHVGLGGALFPTARLEFHGFDARTGTPQFSHRTELLNNVLSCQTYLTCDGTRAISWSQDDTGTVWSENGTGTVWDVATGRRMEAVQGRSASYCPFRAYTPLTAVRRKDGPIELRDGATGQTRRVLKGAEPLGLLACSPKEDILAATDAQSSLILWDLNDNRIRAIRTFDGLEFHSPIFSPGGDILAFGNRAGEIRLLDAGTLRELATLPGHSNTPVGTLAYSPDARTLVSGGSDGTVKLWDVTSKELLFTLQRRINGITIIQFTHDGRMLAFWGDAEPGHLQLHLLPTMLPEDHAEEGP